MLGLTPYRADPLMIVNRKVGGPGMRRLSLVAVALAAAAAVVAVPQLASAASVAITPGTAWKDTSGHLIQAHGGGMVKVGATYYWFGEDKTGESKGNTPFRDVPCYSSTDLAHWKFEANVLTAQKSGDLGPGRIVERPKVIYNKA